MIWRVIWINNAANAVTTSIARRCTSLTINLMLSTGATANKMQDFYHLNVTGWMKLSALWVMSMRYVKSIAKANCTVGGQIVNKQSCSILAGVLITSC